MSQQLRFRVLVATRKKGTVELVIEAGSEAEASKIGRRQGTVMSVKRKRGFSFEDPLTRNDRVNFLTRLAAMQSSKVGASESLSILSSFYKGAIKRVAARMLRHIENGSDIPEAMEKVGAPDFPGHLVAMVKAGAKSGDTGGALNSAVEFEKTLHEIRRQSSGGMWSAMGGFISAVAMTLGTTQYFGPMVLESDLLKMGEGVNVEWSIVLADYTTMAIYILVGIFSSLLLLSSVGKMTMPIYADKIILRIPFYKDLILAKNNFVVLYGLSRLIGSGVPMDQALKLQAGSAPKGSMREDLLAAHAAIKSGRPWAPAMKNLHPTDKAALSTSQDREQISKALESMSRQYQILYAQRVSTLAPVLQFIAVIFLVLSGAILFGQAVMPILQMSAGGFG